MDLFEVIKNRFSYRGAFKEILIPVDHLRKIVQAGLDAPTGKNLQTVQFVIVNEKKSLLQIKNVFSGQPFISTAPAFIVAIVDAAAQPNVPGGHTFVIEDCSAAIQNILLAITALGYASVWLDGVLRSEQRAEKIAKAIGLPESKKVQILLPVGITQDAYTRKEKLRFEERAWFNRYKD